MYERFIKELSTEELAILKHIQHITENAPDYEFRLEHMYLDGKTILDDHVHDILQNLEDYSCIKATQTEKCFRYVILPVGYLCLNKNDHVQAEETIHAYTNRCFLSLNKESM